MIDLHTLLMNNFERRVFSMEPINTAVYITGASTFGLECRKKRCTVRCWIYPAIILYLQTLTIPLHDNYGNYSILAYIFLFTQTPIPGCLDGTIIDNSRIILVTMYYCGYVGV